MTRAEQLKKAIEKGRATVHVVVRNDRTNITLEPGGLPARLGSTTPG